MVEEPRQQKREQHAGQARRKEHAVSPIAEHERPPQQEGFQRLRLALTDGNLQVQGQQRSRGRELDQRGHLGVEAVVVPGPDVVSVVEVVRLIPIGGVHPRHVNQFTGEDQQKRNDSRKPGAAAELAPDLRRGETLRIRCRRVLGTEHVPPYGAV